MTITELLVELDYHPSHLHTLAAAELRRQYAEIEAQAQAQATNAQIEAAYEAGWVEAACWAHRDDLISDIGSPEYLDDRLAHLDSIYSAPKIGDLVSWTLDAPKHPGTYLHKCMETDYDIERLSVFMKNDVLMIESDIGTMDVATYHAGLTDSTWAEIKAPKSTDRDEADIEGHPV